MQALADGFEAFVEVLVLRQFSQAGDDQLAGDVATLMTAHAVRDHPQPMLRGVEEGIFVARPHLARIGSRRAAPGTGHQHQSCTGIRKVRITPMSNGFGVRWLVSR